MDEQWKEVFNANATKDLPEDEMSGWDLEQAALRREIFFALLAKQKEVKSVLDVGCGPGIYCRLLAERGYAVTGIDYAPAMIEVACQKAPQLDFRLATSTALPFPDRAYDLVISVGVLQCVSDFRSVIKELCRVAEKSVIVCTLRSYAKTDADQTLQKMLKNDTWPTRTFKPEDLLPVFEEAGFSGKTAYTRGGKRTKEDFFIVAHRRER